jgi:UPF0271 protein
MTNDRRIAALGDGAIRWRRAPDRDARDLLDALRAHPAVIDAVVTEEHAMVTFDPAHPPDPPWLVEDRLPLARTARPRRAHVIRVRYDGPDLDEVASCAGLAREDVIAEHAARIYVVRLIGFLPGFAYLGPVAPALALPRRTTPRPRVEAGAVGIAGGYTGVYPCASPGGWNLVGRAVDFAAFDVETGARLALGDQVRFEVVG